MKWNKITVDSLNISVDDNKPLFWEIQYPTKISIVLHDNISTRLAIIANTNYDIDIKLGKSSSLIVNSINKDNSVKVNINLLEKANINYNHSVLGTCDSDNIFNINHLENESCSNLVNNGINKENNKLYFTINGKIPKELVNITCNQKSKIINYARGSSKIIPNLIIDSKEIIANHAAYIGEIGEEEKFYLESRGINNLDIKKMIYKAVMLTGMNLLEEESEFNKRIYEWW